MKRMFILVVMLMASLFVGCFESEDSAEKLVQNDFATTRELIARAEFVSLDEVFLIPPMSTEIVDLIPEGTYASAGEEIALLSPGDRLERIMEESAELERSSMKVDLERMKKINAVDIEKKKLELAELELKKSKIEFERAVDLRDWLRIVELEQSLKTEKIRENLLKTELKAARKMVGKGFVARQEMLETEKNLAVTQINASLTARLIPFLESTPDEKRVQQARENYEKNRLAFEVASFTFAKNLADYDFLEKEARRNYYSVASSVALLEKQVESLKVIASESGIVIYGNTYDGAELVKVKIGSQIYRGLNFLSLVNPVNCGINFAVDSKELSVVASQSNFFFRPDAFPEILLRCELSSLAPVALEIPGGRPDGRTLVNLKAKTDFYPDFLKLGYSGTVLSESFYKELVASFKGNRTYRVQTKPFRRKTSTTGDIKPASYTFIVSQIEGKLNEIKEEGKTVKKGEVVAVIDCEETRQSARDVEIELKKKKEELQLLQEKNSLEQERLSTELEVKRGALEVEKLKHATLLKRREEDKIIDLKRSLELIEARIALAREKVEHVKELKKKGLRSELEFLQAENEVFALLKDRAIASYKLRTEESGPTRRSVAISEIEVQKAMINKEKAEKEKTLGGLMNAMNEKILELEIRKLEITLAKLNKKVEMAAIKSPSDGAIVLNETHKATGGLGKARVGDTVYGRVPFMQVADMSNLQVHTMVSEMDAKFIEPGEEVKVFLKGDSVQSFRGWVSSVGYIAQTNFKFRQDAVVKVVVDLLSPENGVVEVDPGFRPGASCEVEFELYNHENALVVPFDAVVPAATSPCVISEDKKLLPVKIGFSDGLNGMLVKEGVEVGQQILLMEARDD
jgi:multidrug resistance efflux pump